MPRQASPTPDTRYLVFSATPFELRRRFKETRFLILTPEIYSGLPWVRKDRFREDQYENIVLDRQRFLLIKELESRRPLRQSSGRVHPSFTYMPSPKPQRVKTIDGIKKAIERELAKQYGKGVRVEVSYKYERIPREQREWKWTWERLGQALVEITEEAIGKDLIGFQKLPTQRIYKIRRSISRTRSAYKESDWIEVFEGNKQELFDWWQEYYRDE